MVAATYQFQLDTLRNNSYSGAIDDLTNYIVTAFWNEGMSEPYAEVASPARLTIQLRNINGEFSDEHTGAEGLANGSFANWTADDPDGWTVTGESGTDPQVSQVATTAGHGGGGTGACNLYTTSAAISIRQSNALVIGQTYRVTLSVTTRTSGALQLLCGSTRIAAPIWEAGAYIFYFNANATSFIIQNWYACDVTIDDVSVVPVALYKNLLRKGTLGRLRATYNGTTYTLFIGRLTSKTPTIGQNSNRQIALEFEDAMIDMLYGDYKPELQTNITVDAAIAPVFDDAVIGWPYSHSYWMLGVAGASELGETSSLFQPSSYAFDTGYTTLDFVGDVTDTTETGTNPQMYIQRMVAAEAGGRFFFNPRTGVPTFHNRNRDVLNTTVSATLSGTDYEAEKSSLVEGTTLENRTTISIEPRKVGAVDTTIWTANNLPITLDALGNYETTARYQDATNGNARMGAQDVRNLTIGSDIVVNSSSDGAGTAMNDKITVSCQPGATTAKIIVHNNYTATIYITTLRLRGTPITTYDPKSVTALNGDSIRDNMLSENTLSIPAISDEEFAQSYADYRVHKFGAPFTRFERIGFFANNSQARMTNALSLSIGSRITVSENWSGHSADYIIVGMTHMLTIGGEHEHTTTFMVKPQAREIFWLLGTTGYSELGSTTRTGF